VGRCGARLRGESRLSEPPGALDRKGGAGTGNLLCFLTVLTWGAQFPIGKSALAVLDGFHASALRYLIAAVVLAALLAWTEGRAAFSFYGRGPRVALAGLVGFTISGLFIFTGLMLTLPEHAAILIATQPSLATLAAWVFWKRRPSVFALACIVVAFVGVVMVVTKGEFGASSVASKPLSGYLGDLLIMCGAIAWVAYTMLSETIRGWSAIRYTTLALLPGTLGIVIITLALDLVGVIQPPTLDAVMSVWPQLLYLGIVSLVISMIAWIAGLKRIGAVNATLYSSLVPVVAFTIRSMQGVAFTALEIAGAALVIGALVAQNLHARRH
jgi:drug/metabolite transporter (DMT)-like permease